MCLEATLGYETVTSPLWAIYSTVGRQLGIGLQLGFRPLVPISTDWGAFVYLLGTTLRLINHPQKPPHIEDTTQMNTYRLTTTVRGHFSVVSKQQQVPSFEIDPALQS